MTAKSSRHVPPPGRVLISQARIRARVRELGVAITKHYRGRRPLLLGVMNGALFFLADLVRALDFEMEISCVRLASYEGKASTGRLRGLERLGDSFAGRDVLVIDDILDTGRTLAPLVQRLRDLGAREVKVCVLLGKKRRREVPVRAEWIGFRIADEFVVGYGLDFDGRYRNLRNIRALKPEPIGRPPRNPRT